MMRRTESILSTTRSSHARIGYELRAEYDKMTSGPMPDRLADLARQLEDAFERGELACGSLRRR